MMARMIKYESAAHLRGIGKAGGVVGAAVHECWKAAAMESGEGLTVPTGEPFDTLVRVQSEINALADWNRPITMYVVWSSSGAVVYEGEDFAEATAAMERAR